MGRAYKEPCHCGAYVVKILKHFIPVGEQLSPPTLPSLPAHGSLTKGLTFGTTQGPPGPCLAPA